MKQQASAATKADLQRRLRRVEGQVRGVQKMLDEERECREVIQQLNAIQAAVRNATSTYMRAYAKDCLLANEQADRADQAALLDDLFELMTRVK